MPDLDGFKDTKVADLSQHIRWINTAWHLLLVRLNASHKVVGCCRQLSNQVIDFLLKLLEQGLSHLIFVLIDKQFCVYFFYFWAYFILILEFEALDVVSDLTLRVHYREIILFDEVESQKRVFAVIALEAGNHVLVFELYVRRVIVDDREKRKFS